MKNCPYCGKAIEESIDQCPNCYANISDIEHIDVEVETKKATKKKGEK